MDCDLFVIGGGSGGVRAARVAANHGARVMIAEEHRYGGTCVIRGCVPKKLLVYGSGYRRELADAAGYGWTIPEPRFDWSQMIAAKDAEIDRLNGIYIQLLEKAGVQVRHERARLADPHTVEVGDRTVTARTILVATGATPFVPKGIEGAALAFSSNEAFHLERLPERIAIIGGGYIAVEFAHIFAGFGAETILIHRRDQVLRGFDEDVRAEVTEGLRAAGVKLELETVVEKIEETAAGRRLHLASGTVRGQIEVGGAMCALGRIPNTADMGLEEAGVRLGARNGVVVDRRFQTSVDNIYAVGDVTDRIQLTPVAIIEGQAVADRLFGGAAAPVDLDLVPTAVFGQPPSASVGLTEAEAREQIGEIRVFKTRFRPMKHTLTGRQEKILIKMVVDAATDRVVGLHMVGTDAPEIIQSAAIALQAGATKADFDATVALHPTTAEELVLLR